MDTESYKKKCKLPEAFSRYELKQTLCALEKVKSDKKDLVLEALQSKAIEKPDSHEGGQDTDYLLVNIKITDAEIIVEALGDLEVSSVSLEGYTTPLASQYASLLDRWLHYVESL